MDAAAIVDFLLPESGERAVLSWIAQEREGRRELICATLLIGPSEMAESSWPDWRGSRPPVAYEEMHVSEFAFELDGWNVGRTTVEVDAVAEWLDAALRGRVPALGRFGGAVTRLGSATAPFQIFPGTEAPLALLIQGAGRPTRGFFFPHEAVESMEGLPWQWPLSERRFVPNAPSELLGIFVSDEPSHGRTPGGLLVGRLERRAWLRTVRGGEGLETFEAHIGLDPDRIDIADLELEFEERIDSALVFNQRIRLEDVSLATVRGHPDVVVSLPTLGTKVAHAVRLRDRDGVLLDMTDPRYLIERIVLSVGLMDGPHETFEVGERRETPSVLERAADVRRVMSEFAAWCEEGVAEKVFQEGDAARSALRAHLLSARGRVSVFDAFFGHRESDWSLLEGLGREVRVLTTSNSGDEVWVPPIEGLQVRVWPRDLARPPFHDRGYLWDGGGVHVGTSPNGFGGRLFRMQRLGQPEAAHLAERFEVWWKEEVVRTVTRAPR